MIGPFSSLNTSLIASIVPDKSIRNITSALYCELSLFSSTLYVNLFPLSELDAIAISYPSLFSVAVTTGFVGFAVSFTVVVY